MRPLRLDAEGFGTFRDSVSLDFSDTDFFALVGPTGSGKTTVIDALCFALYGSAPRWPRANQVSLALAGSVSHCRVSLVFDLARRRFAVTRVLSRTARGQVTTKEARLVELPGDRSLEGALADVLGGELRTLAATAPAVNAKVVELTGLTWDHFIQCVVLPQGGFAKFLHAEPRQRQDLLISLLGLKVYERVMNRANLLAKERQATAAALSSELDRYTDATDDAVRVAEERVEVLRDVPLLVAQRATELAAATEAAQRLEEQAAALASRLTALAEVHEPPGLNELASRRADLVTAQQDAESALEAALVAQDSADQAAGEAGDPRDLQTLIEAHDRLSGLRATRPTLEQDQSRAAAAAREARVVLDEAQRRRTATEAARDAVLTANAADAVSRVLVVGQDCPVCRQPVARIPDRSAHATLDEADGLLRVAHDDENAAQETARRSQRAADQAELRLAQLDEREQQAQESVAGQPALEDVAAAHVQATEARTAALAAAAEVRRARDDQQAARAAVTASDEEWQGLAAAFQTARDPFVGDGAPRATGDPAADWAALAEWANHRRDELTDRQATTERDRQAAVLERDGARTAVRVVFTDHELDPPKDLGQAVVAAHRAADRAETDAARLRERRDTAVRIRVDIAAAQADAVLHHDLAQLLGARYFERWLVAEALDVLVTEASAVLYDLSGGQFELALAEEQIEVVDHNDASLRRPVSTLSGGETFQASLAMALAMSAQIAGLSAVSSRQLETILLDEGFGTLDPASLEVVATTLEQLAEGGGRVVGVVTHVAELAARVPVRFEVSRTGSSSSVVKVSGE